MAEYRHFPKANAKTQYKSGDVVWALINPDMPYWPAQINVNNHVDSNTISITTFNDPYKRKNHKYVVQPTQLLEWDAKKTNDDNIDFVDVLYEYMERKSLNTLEDINDNIFKQWHDYATVVAEKQVQKMHALKVLEGKRRVERQELERARQEEMRKAESMEGQLYDGRIHNTLTGKKEGWVLRAGDKIRYWAPNCNILIKTQIIKLHDKYGTLRAESHVPIVVETSGNPPFWETEIELLPSKDRMNPTFYPLNQCKLMPSEIENEMEKEHMRKHMKWDRDNAKKGWSGILFDNNRNVGVGESDMEVDIKSNVNGNKRKRKRENSLSDENKTIYYICGFESCGRLNPSSHSFCTQCGFLKD